MEGDVLNFWAPGLESAGARFFDQYNRGKANASRQAQGQAAYQQALNDRAYKDAQLKLTREQTFIPPEQANQIMEHMGEKTRFDRPVHRDIIDIHARRNAARQPGGTGSPIEKIVWKNEGELQAQAMADAKADAAFLGDENSPAYKDAFTKSYRARSQRYRQDQNNRMKAFGLGEGYLVNEAPGGAVSVQPNSLNPFSDKPFGTGGEATFDPFSLTGTTKPRTGWAPPAVTPGSLQLKKKPSAAAQVRRVRDWRTP